MYLFDIGDISFCSNRVHWKISYFLHIPQETNTRICSPCFKFGGQDWSITIYPNGESGKYLHINTEGWFGMEACTAVSYKTQSKWDVRFGIVGEHADIVNYRAIFDSSSYLRRNLIRHSAIESNKNRIVPGGHLHLFVSIEKNEDSAVNPATKDKAEDGFKQLSKAFKEILLNGNISDVVLKVEGQEFKAHRCVLAARSPVFLAMMTHETKEKISGVVDIEDSNPNIFSKFLNYLYTGSVEDLTQENAVELYKTADKYQVNGLKEICIDQMMMDVSVDNFCDLLALSIRHDEKYLKDVCILFFSKKSLAIIVTPEWQTFLSENPIIGNELFIKHLQLNK